MLIHTVAFCHDCVGVLLRKASNRREKKKERKKKEREREKERKREGMQYANHKQRSGAEIIVELGEEHMYVRKMVYVYSMHTCIRIAFLPV